MQNIQRLAAVFTLLAAFVGPPAAAAQNADFEQRLEGMSDEDAEHLGSFVAANVVFTLFHEAGHMLVSEFGLPVLGQEEDAVDNLATVLLLAEANDDRDNALLDAAAAWLLTAADTSDDDIAFYDVHDLDIQRGYRMLCLMVGADSETFLDPAVELGLPEEQVATCKDSYNRAIDGWDTTTDPHKRGDGDPPPRINVRYDPPNGDLEFIGTVLREAELLEMVADEIKDIFNLPRPIFITATTCGEENAFWRPDEREITLCYELAQSFAELYLRDLSQMSP